MLVKKPIEFPDSFGKLPRQWTLAEEGLACYGEDCTNQETNILIDCF